MRDKLTEIMLFVSIFFIFYAVSSKAYRREPQSLPTYSTNANISAGISVIN